MHLKPAELTLLRKHSLQSCSAKSPGSPAGRAGERADGKSPAGPRPPGPGLGPEQHRGIYIYIFKQSVCVWGAESRENPGSDEEVKGRKGGKGGPESKTQRPTGGWKQGGGRVWETGAERGGGRREGRGRWRGGLSEKGVRGETRELRRRGLGSRASGREPRGGGGGGRDGRGAPLSDRPPSPRAGGSGSEARGRRSSPPGKPSPRADTGQRPGLALPPPALGGAGGRLPGQRARAGRPRRRRRVQALAARAPLHVAAGGAGGAGGRAEGGGRSAGGTRAQAGAGPGGRPEAAMFPQNAPRGLRGGGPRAPL